MKLAVAAAGDTLDSAADPRFGRCQKFVVVDTESGEVTSVDNPGAMAGSGAGIQAAQTVANTGAEAVIAGNFGPSAAQALEAGCIPAYTSGGGTIAEVVDAFKAGKLEQAAGPTVQSHFGLQGQDPK